MQPLDDVRAPATIAFENDLGIGLCPERHALPSEDSAQLNEIVDLTVEHYDITPITTLHRLIAGSQINDRQAAMAEEHVALPPLTYGIRPTVGNRVKSAPCSRRVDDGSALQDCDKTTHKSASIRRADVQRRPRVLNYGL